MHTQRFADLTDEQVLALNDEQIERFVDLECALAGVPLLPEEEPQKPEPFAAHKDVELFKVGSFYFRNRDDAMSVASLLNGLGRVTLEYAPGGDYRNQIVESDLDDVTIQVERHFSADQWRREKERVVAHAQKEREFEAAQRQYREITEKRRKAANNVYHRLEDVQERHYRRQSLRRDFDRYLSLANGDRDVAARFLADAHFDARELLPDLYPAAEPEPAPVEAEADMAEELV